MGFFRKTKPETAAPAVLTACTAGRTVPMEDIPDAVFSQGILGRCIGIDPVDGRICAPADGRITQCTETRHAIGMQTDSGAEVLIHVGIDTVEMAGEGFTLFVEPGQQVQQGQLLLTADPVRIREAGHPAVTVIAVTNSEDFSAAVPLAQGEIHTGDPLMELRK